MDERTTLPIRAPGIVLGIGLGGFVDGILLHQLLQLHHMFSSIISPDTVSGLRMNTIGDGLFHTSTWLAVLVGLWLLYSRVARAYPRVWSSIGLWGWILCGWGWFNVGEGLLAHEIFGLHHVRAGPHQVLWDMLFLAVGVVFILAGWTIARRARPIPTASSGF